MAEKFKQCRFVQPNQDLIEAPKVFMPKRDCVLNVWRPVHFTVLGYQFEKQ